jgi:hypothetical protein
VLLCHIPFLIAGEYKRTGQFTCTICHFAPILGPPNKQQVPGHTFRLPISHARQHRPPSPRFRTSYRNKVILQYSPISCTVVYFPPLLHAMPCQSPNCHPRSKSPKRAVDQSHQSAIKISHTCAQIHENDPPRPVDRQSIHMLSVTRKSRRVWGPHVKVPSMDDG